MGKLEYEKLPSIKLNRVRLSYPSLFNVKVWKEGEVGKYEATFILDKKTHEKEINQINLHIDTYLAAVKLDRKRIDLKNFCLKDGDLTDHEEYKNSYTIKATSSNRFHIVNKDGVTPVVASDGLFYGGCYVSAYIDLWVYSTKLVKGVSANLKAVQFVADGEAFGVSKFDLDGKFDSIDDLAF